MYFRGLSKQALIKTDAKVSYRHQSAAKGSN